MSFVVVNLFALPKPPSSILFLCHKNIFIFIYFILFFGKDIHVLNPRRQTKGSLFPFARYLLSQSLYNWIQFWPMEYKGKSARMFLGMVFLGDQKRLYPWESLFVSLISLAFCFWQLLLEMFYEGIDAWSQLKTLRALNVKRVRYQFSALTQAAEPTLNHLCPDLLLHSRCLICNLLFIVEVVIGWTQCGRNWGISKFSVSWFK